MKILKLSEFNEAVVDYKSKENDAFIKELRDIISNGRSNFRMGPPSAEIEFKTLQDIGKKYDIEIVDYDTFFDELPEGEKEVAPAFPGGRPIPMTNPVSGKKRIVLGDRRKMPPGSNIVINIMDVDFFEHALKHEQVHIGQISKMKIEDSPNPVRPGGNSYFRDKKEIMALSQSISDMILKDKSITNLQLAMVSLRKNPLYNDIVRNGLDRKTLGRYKKYIYLYLKNELPSMKRVSPFVK